MDNSALSHLDDDNLFEHMHPEAATAAQSSVVHESQCKKENLGGKELGAGASTGERFRKVDLGSDNGSLGPRRFRERHRA